ncbi:hypothetical protein IWW50_003372, partial [Coemansia erecta]
MAVNILTPAGAPYDLRGFQSLSGNKTLALRTGSTPKHPGPDHVSPRWSPKIDVLAVPEGRALRLVRLSGGQTIWRRTLNDGQPRTTGDADATKGNAVRAIAWNPDGTSIAVLHANGLLVQRDSVRGDVVHETQTDVGGAIVAMEWVAGGASGAGWEGELELGLGLPRLGPLELELGLPRLGPLDRGQPAPRHVNPESEAPTAIVITCASGSVWVSLGGIFTLPPARLPLEQQRGFAAVDARLSGDSTTLHVYLADKGSPGRRAVHVCAVDTSVLSSSVLLHALVPLSARLSALCLYLDNALDVLLRESRARQEGASRASLAHTFDGVLRDHGVDEATNAASELCRLAVTGRASEAASQFLLAKLKAPRLSSWESAGRQGALALHRLVYGHAQPAVERTVLAAARLLDVVRASGTADASTQRMVLRAVLVLGWVHERLGAYMDALREEQRENQEFADWALFAIDDLHWQNEGPRRLGAHNNDDGDDGLRPVRPDIDYKLLFRFIRTTFGDSLDGYSLIRDILHSDREDAALDGFATAYFDTLVDRAHLDALSVVRESECPTSGDRDDAGMFEYVFHSQELLDAAAAAYGDSACPPDAPPTCVDALKEVKSLIAQALEWPSRALGDSLKWSAQPSLVCSIPLVAGDGVENTLSDMHYVSDSDAMYTATVVPHSQHLVLLLVSGGPSHQPKVAHVELVVDVSVSGSASQQTPVSVLA